MFEFTQVNGESAELDLAITSDAAVGFKFTIWQESPLVTSAEEYVLASRYIVFGAEMIFDEGVRIGIRSVQIASADLCSTNTDLTWDSRWKRLHL